MTITAQYKCDDREYTVEVIDTDGEDVTIACDVFPLVFVRHVGWCEQPTMTVNKKWIYNIRDIEVAELEQEQHKALKIVLDVTRPTYDELIHGAKFTDEHRAELHKEWNEKYSDAEVQKRLNVTP